MSPALHAGLHHIHRYVGHRFASPDRLTLLALQDLVKTVLQVNPRNRFPVHWFFPDGGFISAWRHTVNSSGWIGLWKGFGPCAARAFPGNHAHIVLKPFSLLTSSVQLTPVGSWPTNSRLTVSKQCTDSNKLRIKPGQRPIRLYVLIRAKATPGTCNHDDVPDPTLYPTPLGLYECGQFITRVRAWPVNEASETSLAWHRIPNDRYVDIRSHRVYGCALRLSRAPRDQRPLGQRCRTMSALGDHGSADQEQPTTRRKAAHTTSSLGALSKDSCGPDFQRPCQSNTGCRIGPRDATLYRSAIATSRQHR